MKEPTKAELLTELRRYRAENERLNRLIQMQRPDRDSIQDVACAVRDLAFEFEMKAGYLGELRDKLYALLGPDNLPSIMEVSGIFGAGRDRVEAAMGEPTPINVVDPVPRVVAPGSTREAD